jgi:hypothetical protein
MMILVTPLTIVKRLKYRRSRDEKRADQQYCCMESNHDVSVPVVIAEIVRGVVIDGERTGNRPAKEEASDVNKVAESH